MAAGTRLPGTRTPAQQEDDLWAEIGMLFEWLVRADEMACYRASAALRMVLGDRLRRVDALREERMALS